MLRHRVSIYIKNEFNVVSLLLFYFLKRKISNSYAKFSSLFQKYFPKIFSKNVKEIFCLDFFGINDTSSKTFKGCDGNQYHCRLYFIRVEMFAFFWFKNWYIFTMMKNRLASKFQKLILSLVGPWPQGMVGIAMC